MLIDPVNLSSGTFKESIKKIIRKIVSEKGDKISIDIFDNSKALEIHYKGYGIMTLGRVFTKQENKELAQHHIAGFSGELKTDVYLNTLYFSPGAFKDHPKVGKYVEIVEFNPKSQ